MCGRFNVSADPLAEFMLDIVGHSYPGEPNPNTAPTENVWVVRTDADGATEAAELRWWLVPYWSKEPSTRYAMFNAKSETLEKSAAFKAPFQRRRCVVPITGFYEWVREKDRKLPFHVAPEAGDAMLLAGLWDRWRARDGSREVQSFTIVTTAAHEDLAFLHNRQPVMLARDEVAEWLAPTTDPATLRRLFTPRLPVSLRVAPVSTHVNNARHKEPSCADPIGPGRTVPKTDP